MSNTFDKILYKNKRLNSYNLILSKCLKGLDYEYLVRSLDMNILPENIKQIVQYIEFYRGKYKKHPTFGEINSQFINLGEMVDTDTIEDYSNEFLIDKVKADYKKIKMLSTMEQVSMKLDGENIDDAYSYMSSEIDKINKLNNMKASSLSLFSCDQSIMLNTSERGWSYGLPSLDRHIGGIHSGEFIVITARPKGNKSFFTRALAMNLMRQGADIFYLCLEGSKEKESKLFTSLLSHVDPFMFQAGIFSQEEKDRIGETFKMYADMRKNNQLFELMDCSNFNKLTPSCIFATIQSMVKDPKKSIVLIDQASWLYDDEQSANQNTMLTNISKACVNFATTTSIPLVVLFQASRDAGVRIIPSAKDIQWSDRPLQDCHVALALGADADMKRDNKKYVKTIANRVGTETCLVMDFDIANGIFKECESDVLDPDEISKKENIL